MSRILLSLCSLLLCVSACKVMQPGKLNTYREKSVSLESKIKQNGDNKVSAFSYDYPEFSDPHIQQFVMQRIVLDSGMQSVDEMAHEFIAEYDRYARESTHVNPWHEERNLEVRLQTPAYIGFALEWNNYTGGAHGMYSTVFYNYDVQDQNELFIHELIEPTRRANLTRLGEEIFRHQEGLSDTASLEEGYFFENGQFYLNDNYTFTPEGILFLYNIYEIKPYVAGQTELLIPYRAVLPLMNKKGRSLVQEIQNKHSDTP